METKTGGKVRLIVKLVDEQDDTSSILTWATGATCDAERWVLMAEAAFLLLSAVRKDASDHGLSPEATDKMLHYQATEVGSLKMGSGFTPEEL